MAGKGKRGHHGLDEESEGKGEPSGDLQALLRVLLESNAKAEADRREERLEAERRAEEREERREEARVARRVEELRAAKELEMVKEEAAREVSERLGRQQQEATDKAYEQQKLLVELQAKIGDKAAETHRVESEKGRKRDRAVSSILNYRDSEDVEDFLQTSERKLRAGDVPEREWVAILASKMGGKVGTTWQDLSMTGEGYEEVKAALLKVCGYTPKLAGEAFYGFKGEALRGMSADQLYHRGVQLLRRMVAPVRVPAELEFALLKPWIWSVVSRRARTLLDARVCSNPSELIGARTIWLWKGRGLKGMQQYFVGREVRIVEAAVVVEREGCLAHVLNVGSQVIVLWTVGRRVVLILQVLASLWANPVVQVVVKLYATPVELRAIRVLNAPR